MNSHPVNLQTPAHEATPTFVWRSHPARTRPRPAIAGAVLIAAFSVTVGLSFSSVIWGIGSAIGLVLALSRFFFPSRFSIDEEGISATYLLTSQRLAWKNVRRFVHDARGAYLSTRARHSRLDAYRGIHIVFDIERHTVISRIEDALAAAKREKEPDAEKIKDRTGGRD